MARGAADIEYIQKLKNKFLSKDGASRMSDEELMGLLLSFAKCDRPIETTVNNICERFGGCRRAYMATYDELIAVDGVTRSSAVLILIAASLTRRKYAGDYIGKRVDDYAEMFLSVMRRRFDEQLWTAIIREDGRIAAVECISVGASMSVSVDIQKLLRFATMYGSTRVVIAHSHPEGSSTESSFADVASIEKIDSALAPFDVHVIGYVIVSGREAAFYEYH